MLLFDPRVGSKFRSVVVIVMVMQSSCSEISTLTFWYFSPHFSVIIVTGSDDCEKCFAETGNERQELRPNLTDFDSYLPFFLDQFPDTSCPKGGRAQFLPAISFDQKDPRKNIQCEWGEKLLTNCVAN